MQIILKKLSNIELNNYFHRFSGNILIRLVKLPKRIFVTPPHLKQWRSLRKSKLTFCIFFYLWIIWAQSIFFSKFFWFILTNRDLYCSFINSTKCRLIISETPHTYFLIYEVLKLCVEYFLFLALWQLIYVPNRYFLS